MTWDKVYGTSALSYSSILWWINRFKSGRDTIEDDPRTGRPLSAFTENDVDVVCDLINKDVRCTVEEVAMCTGINSSAVFTILKQCLKIRKVYARWVPHLLIEEQKRNRLDCAKTLLEKYENFDPRKHNEIVTGDGT